MNRKQFVKTIVGGILGTFAVSEVRPVRAVSASESVNKTSGQKGVGGPIGCSGTRGHIGPIGSQAMKCLLVMLTVFFSSLSVFASFDDLNTDSTYIDVALQLEGDYKVYDITGMYPFVNGWAGLQLSQIMSEGKLENQDILAHIQNGFRFTEFDIGIEAFIDAEYNSTKGTDTHAIGAFFRPAIIKRGHFIVSGGAGSFVENEDVRADLGLKETDATVLTRWIAFVSAKYNPYDNVEITGLLKTTPAYDLRDWQNVLTLGAQVQLNNRYSVGSTWKIDQDSHPVDITISKVQWQLSTNLRIDL